MPLALIRKGTQESSYHLLSALEVLPYYFCPCRVEGFYRDIVRRRIEVGDGSVLAWYVGGRSLCLFD